MAAVDDYLKALERQRSADPRAFAMKVKGMTPNSTTKDFASYVGNMNKTTPPAVAARSRTSPPRGSNMHLQQMADYDWGSLGMPSVGANLAARAQPAAIVGPGNMEGMRPLATAAQHIQNSGESPERIAANLDALTGLSIDEMNYFNAAVDSGFFDAVAAAAGQAPAPEIFSDPEIVIDPEIVVDPPLDMGGGGPFSSPPPLGPLPTGPVDTSFGGQQKAIIDNALQDTLGYIQAALDAGLMDIETAQGLWEQQQASIYEDFMSEQDLALAAFAEDQAAERARMDALNAQLMGDVDASLAADTFAISDAISRGAAQEDEALLSAMGRIGGMSDDALTMMGVGNFGNIEQGLRTDARNLGLAAELGSVDDIRSVDEAALYGDVLGSYLNLDPNIFAAGQMSGTDVAGIQAGRDAAVAAAQEAAAARALSLELAGMQDATSRYGVDQRTIMDQAQLDRQIARDSVDDARWRTEYTDDAFYQDELLDMQEREFQQGVSEAATAAAQGWAALDPEADIPVVETVFMATRGNPDAWTDVVTRIDDLQLGGLSERNFRLAIQDILLDEGIAEDTSLFWEGVLGQISGLGGGMGDPVMGGDPATAAAIADQVAEIVYGTGADNLSESEEMLKELLEAEAAIDPTRFQEPGDFNLPGAPDPLGIGGGLPALGNLFDSDRVMVQGKSYPPEAYRALILGNTNVEENDIRDYIERVLGSGKVWNEPTKSWN